MTVAAPKKSRTHCLLTICVDAVLSAGVGTLGVPDKVGDATLAFSPNCATTKALRLANVCVLPPIAVIAEFTFE